MMLKCNKCKKFKKEKEFNKHKLKLNRNGRNDTCKICKHKQDSLYYSINKITHLKSSKLWAKNNPNKVKVARNKYNKKRVKNLTLGYINNLLNDKYYKHNKVIYFPKEILEAKKSLLQLKRSLKLIKNEKIK